MTTDRITSEWIFGFRATKLGHKPNKKYHNFGLDEIHYAIHVILEGV
jgi:hypothetical protein